MSSHFFRRSFKHLLIVLFSVWVTYYNCHAGSFEVNKTHFQCVESERDALLHFKRGISVDHCGLLDSWRHTQDCCRWPGIRCDNQSGHVIGIKLRGSRFDTIYGIGQSYNPCFEGTLSISLINLKHLKYLDLSSNNFNGQLPKFIGSFASLEQLNLSQSGFSGVIPQEIGNLSRLTSLDLNVEYSDEDNNMRVDNLWWLSRMRLLREVDLSGIDLSATTNIWLSIVNNLPSLRELRLGSCQLSQNSPSSLSYINSSTTLTVIDLHINNLNDTSIFEWLFNLSGLETNLIYLDLSNNQMFANNLQLSLHAMKLLDNLCSLQTLDMSNTNLNYKFSDILQSFATCPHKALVSLLLSENKVWGTIPDSIGAFYFLRELVVGGNNLNGTITQPLGKLTMLEKLDLSFNSLNGTLTIAHLSNLSKLRYLDLSLNKEVVVNIRVDWIPPFQLDTLYLGSCKIGPYFPRWITTQKNLLELDISNASISDTIPHSFWSSSLLSEIVYLVMSHNMIYGMIPDISIIFNNSPQIDLSYNFLEGVIPSFLRNNVSHLYLNNNKFSGGLFNLLCPHAQVIRSPLSDLDISNNLLSEKFPNCSLWGNLPTSMGELDQLLGLKLSNNNLSGEIPASLVNCKSLIFLDVANNSLVGHIPPSFGHSLGNLVILNLQNNGFTGVLPTSFCDLSQLQLMDLSGNHISGTIPKCLYKLVSMSNTDGNSFEQREVIPDSAYGDNDNTRVMWKRNEQTFGGDYSLGLLKGIDISNNKLEGHIPEGISNLIGLKFLNLSRNNLTGFIMPRIGQLTSLESLDLSHNHLTGEIPASLAQVSYLTVFDISDNNLTGKIPVGTQLQSFDASNYMGNPGLCGAPLPTCVGDEAPAIAPNGYHEQDTKDNFMLGVYISVILGFIVGFWGVCGTLVVKRSWRHAYFRFYEDIKDMVYVIWPNCKFRRFLVIPTIEFMLRNEEDAMQVNSSLHWCDFNRGGSSARVHLFRFSWNDDDDYCTGEDCVVRHSVADGILLPLHRYFPFSLSSCSAAIIVYLIGGAKQYGVQFPESGLVSLLRSIWVDNTNYYKVKPGIFGAAAAFCFGAASLGIITYLISISKKNRRKFLGTTEFQNHGNSPDHMDRPTDIAIALPDVPATPVRRLQSEPRRIPVMVQS
ncbi:receptor-like protein EIX2 [Silene latifolia]|uniref:receptor-like protein EIX2 n=1 Tax=Silene latifolia TaxID=37657 RepID=UPI003D787C86